MIFKLSNNFFLTLILLCSVIYAQSANLDLVLKIKDVGGNQVKVVSAKVRDGSGEPPKIYNSRNGVLNIDLNYNNTFVIEVDAKGFETLEVNVDSELPDEMLKYGYEYALTVALVPSREGFEVEYSGDPAVYISYNTKADNFKVINKSTPTFEYFEREGRKIDQTSYTEEPKNSIQLPKVEPTDSDLTTNKADSSKTKTSSADSSSFYSESSTKDSSKTNFNDSLNSSNNNLVEEDTIKTVINPKELTELSKYKAYSDSTKAEMFSDRDIKAKEERAEIARQLEEEKRIEVQTRKIMAEKRRNLFEEIAGSKKIIKKKDDNYTLD